MRPYLLAGGIGGTRSLLELFESRDGAIRPVHEESYRSQAFPTFDALLDDFLHVAALRAAAHGIAAACFSVAGRVEANACQLSNLPWRIDGAELGPRYDIPEVVIVNDFAAVGYGIAELGARDMITLQRGVAQPDGTRLAVGAGTGLGVCMLTRDAERYAVHASEAGHIDFAPVTPAQDALLTSLRKTFEHVSYERVVSGPGLLRIFAFLRESGAGTPSQPMREAMQRQDAAAAISQFAINKLDPLAVRTLDLFVEIYGAFAGNMALATLARGGVYIAGGIGRQIAGKLDDGSFMRSFTGKGRFSDFLCRCPVHVVTDRKVGLKGALSLIRRA